MAVLRAGAIGYVRKDAEPETLLAAVRAVAQGKTYIDPSVSRQILQAPASPSDLTQREVEVLRQLALGLANKEIAHVLSITEETVSLRAFCLDAAGQGTGSPQGNWDLALNQLRDEYRRHYPHAQLGP